MSDAPAYRISAFVLSWIPVLGLSLSEVALAADIPLAKLEGASELTYGELVGFWQALERLTEDPVIGLRAGSRFTIDQMGVMGPAVAACPSLDSAIDLLVHLMSAFVRNVEITRYDDEHSAGLAYRMPSLRTRHGLDNAFASIVALVRQCTGSCLPGRTGGRGPLVLHAVHHQSERAAEHEYVRFFGVAPTWSMDTSRVLFRREDLSLPFRGASPELAQLLGERALELLQADEVSVTFERELARAFWRAHQDGEATLETTSEAMGMSPRTLQRRLTAQETTFADERAKLLGRRASELLLDESLTIDAIAERLGYASRSAFERAFVRWSGKTPHQVRAGT
ncbi:MAG: AraC family transcriptional regulator ligand-binding domain-containing protein [Sandaracinus sp.]